MSALPNQSVIRNDSLEYFIKFPTPNFRNNREIGESDYVFVYNETNVPIVLLLGWAGCKDRYLMKYSKIYEDRGLITVRYTAPVENLFFKREAMKPIGDKIVKLIYDMNFDTHPLIFHVFSNGGAYLYQHIWLAFRQYSPTVQIRAVIFDSAPGDRHMVALYRAISAIYGKQKPFNFLVSWLITLFLTVLWFVQENFHKLGLLFGADNPAKAHPFENLKNQDCYAPQLFLYSKHDKLVPYTDVEYFAHYRQSRGVHVQLQCFENSDAEHVKLYASQPQRYVQSVCEFINDCFACNHDTSDFVSRAN
ncbi:transmembrane protein 53 isoform X1 [Bradysia coprophila]|uniref:transmembrane protein 53 isoform X1 n=1 Tax=Bradysia coprophila TaxID=38358 RepID=UPI00187D8F71|nr:transmembrane protein 53 isoform X1 [Bradysia coprophila]